MAHRRLLHKVLHSRFPERSKTAGWRPYISQQHTQGWVIRNRQVSGSSPLVGSILFLFKSSVRRDT